MNGKKLRSRLISQLINRIGTVSMKPKLVIIQIGNQKESNTYIKKKKLFAHKIGALVVHKCYSESVLEREVVSDIMRYNLDASVHGVMVQLPIPVNLNSSRIIEAIDHRKDVDGLTAKNMKFLFDNNEGFIPATLKGIITLLHYYRIDFVGKKVVIVGDSLLVARPAIFAFLNRKTTVTVCHAQTKNLEKETKRADVLIIAADQPHLITAEHVSKNQVVIDAGSTMTTHVTAKRVIKKMIGDVDYKKVKNAVSAITPVPDGVGPMTVFSLFENLVTAYLHFIHL